MVYPVAACNRQSVRRVWLSLKSQACQGWQYDLRAYPETTLEELLSDEITQAVMLADGVDAASVRMLMQRISVKRLRR